VPQIDISKGYAITLNKAQGSEYDYVFIAISARSLAYCCNSRWMYTACTRAKKCIYLVTNDKIYLKTYNAVVSRPLSSLVNSTLVAKYFRGETIEEKKLFRDWLPTVKVSETYDNRIDAVIELSEGVIPPLTEKIRQLYD
jgi:hypothetical protein